MKKLLYIHGYNGSPTGRSRTLFDELKPEGWMVIGMDHDETDCATALRQIRETIEREQIDVVAGSSLGGFLTLLTTGVRRCVINPCYSPSVELPRLSALAAQPMPDPRTGQLLPDTCIGQPLPKALADPSGQTFLASLPQPSEAMVASYAAYESQLKGFSPAERALITGFFAPADELLGERYLQPFTQDVSAPYTLPGGHHLTPEGVAMVWRILREG